MKQNNPPQIKGRKLNKKLLTKDLRLEKSPVKGYNMSLDIIAIDLKKAEKAKDDFFKKYDLLSYIAPHEEAIYKWLDIAAYNTEDETPKMVEWRKRMAKKLNIKVNSDETELYTSPEEKVADLAYGDYDDLVSYGGEVDSYHIGYGVFHFFREELAPYCNAKYYYAEYDSLHHPMLDSYMFQSPDEWEHAEMGKSLFNFFMHSDCDGTLNAHDVKNLRDYLKQHHIYQKMQEKSSAPRKEQFLDFIKWIENQTDNIYWRFI